MGQDGNVGSRVKIEFNRNGKRIRKKNNEYTSQNNTKAGDKRTSQKPMRVRRRLRHERADYDDDDCDNDRIIVVR